MSAEQEHGGGHFTSARRLKNRRRASSTVWSASVALLGLLAVSCGSTVVGSRSGHDTSEIGLDAGGAELTPGASQSSLETLGPGGVGSIPGTVGGSIPQSVGKGTKEVKIGIYYGKDSGNAALKAAGAQNTSVPEMRPAAEILVNDVNARGGIAGRKLVPVWHAGDLSDRAAADQAACEDFTKDRPVAAVITLAGPSDIVAECLGRARIPYVLPGNSDSTAASFRRYPLKAEPVSLNLDRKAQVMVDGLAAQSYFEHAPGSQAATLGLPVKLGVITFDEPSYRDVYSRVLAPGFKTKGVPVSLVRYVRTDDPTNATADIQSAVLAFSQANITHVAFFVAGGSISAFFIIAARSQRYEPRYAFTSGDAPQIIWQDNIRQIYGDSAKSQYRGALGVGWQPFGDVANPTQPGVAPPSYVRCLDVMRKGGMPPKDANYNSLLLLVCDGFWFLDTALEAGGAATLSPSSFLAGMNSLGQSYLPAAVTGTRFAPDKHDGVGSIRYFAFIDSCSCFRYTTGKIRV